MVLLSGGIDSATCLYLAKKRGESVRAVTFRIHGTASSELRSARAIARRARVIEHRVVRIPEMREAADISGRGPLSKGKVPPTYIPMKNAVFYSLAASFADEVGAGTLVGGHNKDDAGTFVDTTDSFFHALQKTLRAGSPRLESVVIRRPLKDYSKADVVRLAAKTGVPLELTWSCHRDGPKHCWECNGCRSRSSAFEAAGVSDPLA